MRRGYRTYILFTEGYSLSPDFPRSYSGLYPVSRGPRTRSQEDEALVALLAHAVEQVGVAAALKQSGLAPSTFYAYYPPNGKEWKAISRANKARIAELLIRQGVLPGTWAPGSPIPEHTIRPRRSAAHPLIPPGLMEASVDDPRRRIWSRPKELTMVLDRQVARGDLSHEDALILGKALSTSQVYNADELGWFADWIDACERARAEHAKSSR